MKKASKSSGFSKHATEYYGLNRWGGGHFSISEEGNLLVHPQADDKSIALIDIVKEAAEQGLRPPLTIRVQDLLRRRVVQINEAFARAIKEEKYRGLYRGVFPIKVNQLREVVDEILDAGKPYTFGLEAGSKPELLIALALVENQESLILCNGYKDAEYIELALIGRRLGKKIILVIEQLSEVDAILNMAQAMGITPIIGIRLKLQSRGEGKWATSTGDNAKFGLSATEIVTACKKIKDAGLAESLQLIHFHIGSQVPNILTIKQAVVEATRYYCEIYKMGFPLKYFDTGGGLGIDYDGSRTNFESSMNYSMEVYARDIVFNVKSICDSAHVPEPDLVTESGRAIVAPHSILVMEVVDRIAKLEPAYNPKTTKTPHRIISELKEILNGAHKYGMLERYHDAQQKKEEINSLFSLGYLDLETRAEGEFLFWQICLNIHQSCLHDGYVPDELAELEGMLSEQYVCNFSVFQSLLDHWALGQLFPIVPLHRLQEEPTVNATIVDITCDSDGKISEFIDLEDVKKSIRLHPYDPSQPYYLGIFLVGAYQDIMGDFHNLFGRVNEVHVFLEDDEDSGFYIEEAISGFSTDEVLSFIQHKGTDLVRLMKKQIDQATKNDLVKPREGIKLLAQYSTAIKSKTYLEPGKTETLK